MSREAIQCDYSWGLLSFAPQTHLSISRKAAHLLQSPLNRFSRTSQTLCPWCPWVRIRHQGKGVHMREHTLSPRIWVSSFLPAPFLHPLLFIFFPNPCLFHVPLHHLLHPWLYPRWRWTLLSSPPLYPSPPPSLSLSNYVRRTEWIDPGSVFIGSVISTACSHAPLKGWGIGLRVGGGWLVGGGGVGRMGVVLEEMG